MSSKTEVRSVPAMAFYHQDGLVPAWKQATRFAGEGGRIAILPDIIESRMATEPGSVPWERYFTTATAEYMGRSRGGSQILIVAHGVGPMATLDGICKAYSHEYKDKSRNNRGGRISQKEFLDLESGKYGEVHVVDLEAVFGRYEYAFLSILRVSQAMREPLLKARFGPKAEAYIERHARFAREWHREQAGVDPDNKYNLPNHGQFLDRRRALHIQMMRADSDPYIIQMGDAANCCYKYHKPEDGMAVAHLISTSGLMNMHHEGNESLVNDVDCHEWWNGVRLASVRAGAVVTDIHRGVDSVSDLIHKNWRLLMKPVSPPARIGFRALVKVGREWFTQYPKQGARMDTYEPEFHVTSLEKVGKPTEFVTTIGGYHGFFKYDIKEVRAIAPKGANAYTVVGDPEIVSHKGNPEHHRASVQFYRVEVDATQRLVREDDLCNDYDTLMSLLTRESKVA